MINLRNAVNAWGLPAFNDILKTELEQLGVTQLPLQQGLAFSHVALDTHLKVIILASSETNNNIIVKAGIFYTGIISGCNCADDPGSVDEQNEYCEVQLDIKKISGDTVVSFLAD